MAQPLTNYAREMLAIDVNLNHHVDGPVAGTIHSLRWVMFACWFMYRYVFLMNRPVIVLSHCLSSLIMSSQKQLRQLMSQAKQSTRITDKLAK